MEIFVRLALNKYFKTKICKSQSEAVMKFFDDDLMVTIQGFDSRKFRQKYLWKGLVDEYFEKN